MRSSLPRPLGARLWFTLLVLGLLTGQLPQALAVSSSDAASQAFQHLEFRSLGPAVQGGRVTSLAVVESDPRTFYVGTASGNLWKTTNWGTTFQPLFQGEATASIGAVTVAPSDSSVIWVGTGEANNRQSSPYGEGVYRSGDGGFTWRHLGLEETRHIGRIVVHPSDPDTAWVAALGHLWGPNEERGVYLTRDAGSTWRKVLDLGSDTGAVDLAMHPSSPQVLFAAAYQRRRTAYGFAGGGEGGGIFRSRDGGETWQELTQGLPSTPMGRIGLAVAPSHAERLYAIVEASDGGLYLSENAGDSFVKVNDRNPRPMYFSKLAVNPLDADHVWMLGVRLHESRDAGATFSRNAAPLVHPDHHAIWISRDGKRMLLGGDGGLSTSFDGGATWRMLDNLPISQFYKIGVDMDHPYHIYGGMQDNGTWKGPSSVDDARGVRNADWVNLNGGDGFYAEVDPGSSGIVYLESQRGRLVKVDSRSGARQLIQPIPLPGDPPYRWNWNTPLLLSRHHPGRLYAGANKLLRSDDGGHSWKPVSPDLTRALDRRYLPFQGEEPFAMLSQHDGVAYFGTLTALEESPLDSEVIYAGSDDGRLHVTRDEGESWEEIGLNIEGLPEQPWISRITASASSPGRVYVSFDNHRNDDYRPLVYASQDFGATWRPIVEGLPQSSVNLVLEDPLNPDLLYLGNEMGLYLSLDQGAQWRRLKANLPTVPVDDIVVHPRENDLIVATHGRGLWILDDASPLQEWKDGSGESVQLFTSRPAQIRHFRLPQSWTGDADYAADNPPYGALIRYFLPRRSGDFSLRIVDPEGQVVRTLQAPDEAGMHRVVWDLRMEPPQMALPRRGRLRGPHIAPGPFRVRLESGGQVRERPLDVRLSPSIGLPEFDLNRRQQALGDLMGLLDSLDLSFQAVRRLNDALDGVEEAGQDEQLGRLRQRLSRSAQSLGELRRRLPRLLAAVDSSFLPPTADQLNQAQSARLLLAEALQILDALRLHDVPALYQRAGRSLPDLGEDWPTLDFPLDAQRGNK
ncbi:MAG TPA: glycosyl hydrolase [Acidobacteriota bacterium]|nr:glycosyl hydrolase [Acidobacteriota bacterium]